MAGALEELLAEAQQQGFIGPGDIATAIGHARGFAAGIDVAPGRVVDLGSGAGLPGLVLAGVWTGAQLALVEAGERRAAFLRRATRELELADRVEVVERRAEAVGREPRFRGTNDLVVARSFGPPAVTAECAAPLLRVGGRLVVSEPPATDAAGGVGVAGTAGARGSPGATGAAARDRWPLETLAELGLALGPAWSTPFRYQSLVQVAPCPGRYPRRVGVPAKRPLY